jgi:ribonuclease HII
MPLTSLAHQQNAQDAVIAKVTYDCIMVDYHQEYPEYGFEKAPEGLFI